MAGEQYIDCANQYESIEDLARRLIRIDGYGNLFLSLGICSLVTLTEAEFQALIASDSLVIGWHYVISDDSNKLCLALTVNTAAVIAYTLY